MTELEQKALYEDALSTWGVDAQVKMVYEEIGELLTAMARFDRGRATEEDVITEIADVQIMMGQMGVLFGYDKFIKEKEYKLTRLKERLEKAKNDKSC